MSRPRNCRRANAYAASTENVICPIRITAVISAVTTNAPGFAASLSYSATDAYLGLNAMLSSLTSGLGINAQHVAQVLDTTFNTTGSLPSAFTPLYLLGDEWAAEIANRTIHGVLHLGWVPDPTGVYRGQMAVLVKRNGLLGTGYMAAIAPFRHLLVYPSMIREIEQNWLAGAGDPTPTYA